MYANTIMKGTTYWIPQNLKNKLAKKSNGICYYCNTKAKKAIINRRGVLQFFSEDGSVFHIDHVIPIHNGGSHEEGNLVMACAKCNLSKRKMKMANDPDVIRIIKSINV